MPFMLLFSVFSSACRESNCAFCRRVYHVVCWPVFIRVRRGAGEDGRGTFRLLQAVSFRTQLAGSHTLFKHLCSNTET